ncbi:MAG: NACHT domain-containing protein [Chitinophagaceae bacterium]
MTEISDSLPTKEILTAVNPFIKSIVDIFVTPKLESLKKRFALDRAKNYVPTEEHFSEYFFRTYKRLSIVNTLVFNNSQRVLKEIYLPLTLSIESEYTYKMDSFPTDLLSKYEKVLITDNAGMGKSTIVKKMFIDVIDEQKGIPIFIELRRLSKERKIVNEILEQLSSSSKEFDKNLFSELLSQGEFIFFFDGYDEIPLSGKGSVTADIQTFILNAPNNRFILTSRPESALKGFGDFQQISICPLKKKEAFSLLRKFDRQGSISALLIKKLEGKDMSNVDEFLTNPLLVSLLFTAFSYKQKIPFKKYIFYRQVFDSYFESHDLTKGDSYTHDKYSKLEIDDFHRVLRYIGFSCLRNGQVIEFNKDKILELIRKGKEFCTGLQFSESDFLKDLITTVPLFIQDGNYYRWAHKSLQEYFAAQFIYLDSKGQQSKILMQLYNSEYLPVFINTLDLYYDIDTKTFRGTILYEILSSFEKFVNVSFQDIGFDIPRDEILRRIEVCFQMKVYFFGMGLYDEIKHNSNLNKVFEKNNEKSIISIIRNAVDKKLACFCICDIKMSMDEMLVQKIPEIFRFDSSLLESSWVPLDDNSERSFSQIKYYFESDYESYLIDDRIDNQFNFAESFSAVTGQMAWGRRARPFNSEKALALLAEIRMQIQTENNDSFLLDGI